MTAITIPTATRIPSARIRTSAERQPRRLPASVYWRRRVTVVLAMVCAAVGAHAALEGVGGGPLTATGVRPSPAGVTVVDLDTKPVARQTYVVRSGDTLWTIARRIQPAGDVRPLVDALASSRHGRPLQPGERIVVP